MARGPIPDKDPSRPTVPEVRALIDAYYEEPGNEVGGNLHIVLDDFNIGESHLRWAIEYARSQKDDDGVKIAEMLLAMTTTQRRKAVMGVRAPFIVRYWCPPPRVPDADERIKNWERHLPQKKAEN